MVHGIELSRRFYGEVVAPWLARVLPDLRHAAALVGDGSEVLGFDDAMSQDHDFGPRVQLYVREQDLQAARAIAAAFADEAPARFPGLPTWFLTGSAIEGDCSPGLSVQTVAGAVETCLGGAEPVTATEWLGLPEQRLLSLTAGAVFRDDDGALTALRERLAWFPRDVWLYKIASQWRRIGEEQPFVGRAGYVGDELGSRIIAARLARDVMRLAFLVERRYAPYPKWFGTAFAMLSCADQLSPLLTEALAADAWQAREAALAKAYLALAHLSLARRLPGRIAPRIGPHHDRPFTVINAAEIAEAVRAEIAEEAVRTLPLIGSLDQVSDATAVVEAPARARSAMDALLR